MDQDIEKILFTSTEIQAAVQRLGRILTENYRDKNPVVVGILRGAAPFMIDLVRAMDCYLEIDFMAVSSYGDATESSGTVKIIKDLDTDVTGRHALIVEDIVDTGRTAQALKGLFAAKNTASTKICSLLDKPERREVDIQADYVGIKTPNEFVVGYGLDFRQQYRNLPYIGVLKPEIHKKQLSTQGR
jgi:hypoxanthine phosphoribosyltransferase